MAQILLNNRDSGYVAKNAINNNFKELYGINGMRVVAAVHYTDIGGNIVIIDSYNISSVVKYSSSGIYYFCRFNYRTPLKDRYIVMVGDYDSYCRLLIPGSGSVDETDHPYGGSAGGPLPLDHLDVYSGYGSRRRFIVFSKYE